MRRCETQMQLQNARKIIAHLAVTHSIGYTSCEYTEQMQIKLTAANSIPESYERLQCIALTNSAMSCNDDVDG